LESAAAASSRKGKEIMIRNSEAIVDGVRSPLLEAGPRNSREAVVFVHGNPGFSRDWQDLLGRVGEFARCLAPDMPGFGAAGKPETFEYTVPGYARHLDGVLTRAGVEKAHLVLHDFGGPWGLAWALANPDRLASLSLIDTGLLPGYRWHAFARAWRTPLLGELSMAVVSRRGFHIGLKRGNPRGLPAHFIDAMYDHFDAGTKRAILRLYRATDNPGEMGDRYGDIFRSWTCPACVIWGRSDPYIGAEYADRQRDYFRQAEVTILDGSGHWPFVDNPEAVAAILLPFLRKHTVENAPNGVR
jgi:pimeloyl-ACP methyl ester carboxylesterase